MRAVAWPAIRGLSRRRIMAASLALTAMTEAVTRASAGLRC
jgi:hypothetical protein